MPAQGQVETGIAAVAAGYAALTVANGYSVDVRYVGRHLIAPASLKPSQKPAVFVVPNHNRPSDLEAGGTVYRELVHLEVIGYRPSPARNPDDFGLATRAQEFLSDLRLLAAKDPTFGTQVVRDSIIKAGVVGAAWDRSGLWVSIGLDLRIYWDAAKFP